MILALSAAPASASKTVFDFFGGTGSGAGKFATGLPPKEFGLAVESGPTGIAVNDTTGDVYVADRVNNRINQFDSDENFIRSWGVDVISGGATGTGTLTSGSSEVTSVATTSRAFIPGQVVSGTGIPAGTTILTVTTGTGISSKMVLSNKATAGGSGVAIAAAQGTGNVAQNEKQTVSLTATAGNFMLRLSTTMPTAEATSAEIPFNATASTVQSALESLANIGAGNVEVTGAAGGPYVVEFKGARFADTNVPQLTTVAGSPALSGPGAIRVATTQEGAGRFEKCTIASSCQAGAPVGIAGAMNGPTGVAVSQANQNVYVTDTRNRRVNQYDASGTFVRSWGADVVESGPDNKPEVQSIKVVGTSGSFTLRIFNNFVFDETAPIPYNATPGEVETALNALGAIGGAFGSVNVTGGPGNATGSNPYQITFGGALANVDVGQIGLNTNGLGIDEGTLLSCTAGPGSATLSYQWLRNGTDIAGATSSTYTTVAADAGQAIQCKAKASNGSVASVRASAPPIVASPIAGSVPSPLSELGFATGDYTVGSTLTCITGTWGGSPTFTYQWLRNGNPIGGATSSTYTLQAADSLAAVQCEVIGTNAAGAAVNETFAKVVRSVPPANDGSLVSAPTISGTASVGNVLTCNAGTWSGSPSFTYQWLRNGIAIGSATATTYTTVAADEGAAIQCQVTATDSGGSGVAVSTNTVIAPVPNPVPPARPTAAIGVSGTRNVGQTLTCAPGTWTPASPAATFSYRWLRNGAAISGATSNTYVPVAADLDKLVQCQVTASNTKGASVAISAAEDGSVIGVPSVNAASSVAALSAATTTTQGASAEICNAGVDVCKVGVLPGNSVEFGGTFGTFLGNSPPDLRLAVAPGGPYAGKLFVADSGFSRIQIFNPDTGAFIATFGNNVLRSGPETAGKNVCIAALGDICKSGNGSVFGSNQYGVTSARSFAIDSTGAVYVPSSALEYLQKYSPDLSSEQDFAPFLCSPQSLSRLQGCEEVAVDLSNDDVYLTYGTIGEKESCFPFFGCFKEPFTKEKRIARLDSAGSQPPVETDLLTDAGILRIHGLAIDGSTGSERSGRVYFTTDTPEQRVDVLGEPTPPTFGFDPIDPEDVKAHEVTVKGTVNPNGNKIHTSYHFEILVVGSPWKPFPVPDVDLGNGTSPVSIEETIPNLHPNTKYRIRLVVSKGSRNLSPEQTFTTPQSGPDAVTGVARWSGPPSSNPSLTFSGTVDDNNLPAHYYFEYGADASYGARVPIFESATFPAGQEPFLARQTVNGLDSSGTYHYRLVARTSSGTSFGADHEVGPAQSGGRFPELVSPTNKGVGKIGVGLGPAGIKQLSWQASPSGNRMAYMYEYGDTSAYSGGELLYLAKRGGSSWANEQLNPPSTVPSLGPDSYGFTDATPGLVKWLSPDMTCGFVMSHGKVTDDVPALDIENNIWHLFRRSDDGSFTRITPSPLNLGNWSVKVRGATADCSRVIFQSNYKYLPGMPVVEKAHIYEWEETTPGTGTVRLVDVLPNGTIPPAGGLRYEEGSLHALGGGGEVEMNAVSPDVNRAFFIATSNEGGDSGKKAIFVRKNHATTVDVSQSQTATPNNGTTEYEMASEDGSHVFFTARAGLASNSVTTTGTNLYDYNVDTGVLKDLTPDTNPADTAGASVLNMLGASEDGSYAYFAAKGQLVPSQGKTYAENNAGSGFYNVYLAHAGALSYVGGMTFADGQDGTFVAGIGPVVSAGDPITKLQSRVAGGGQYLLFRSSMNLTSYDTGGFLELYLYSASGSSVVCVSCRTDGQPPSGSSRNFLLTGGGNEGNDTHHQRSISDDGSRIFFNSDDKLTADAEENGNRHVYEWHDGTVSLLVNNGRILDSSTDGSSAFVLTTEPLVAQDQDGARDIYDFRIEGGFPYVAKERCDPLSEGSCQGNPPPPPPATADPASSTFNGPGNPPVPGAKQHKKHHKKQGKKHHKKQKANKQRAAKHNGGGSK